MKWFKVRRRWIGWGAVCLWGWMQGITVSAQEPSITCYPEFINVDSNRIVGDQAALYPFFAKLEQLSRHDSSVVSILHLGDSHVQAGFFSGVLRESFQRDFGNAGRGLVVPLRLIGTNEPPDYAITSPAKWDGATCILHTGETIGLSGMSIHSSDPKLELTLKSENPFDRIRAFHHDKAPLLVGPDSLCDGPECADEPDERMTIIQCNSPVKEIVLKTEITDSLYNEPLFYGFSLENGHPGILYHSWGINGNTFTAINRNPQILCQASLLEPDLVIVSLGTNDSYGRNFSVEEVESQIGKLIDLFRKYLPDAVLLFTTPMEHFRTVRIRKKVSRQPNPNVAHLRNRILVQTTKYHLPVWDFYTVAGGKDAMMQWHKNQKAHSDKIHLSKEGYELQGSLFYNAFFKAYTEYLNFHKQ